MSGKKTPRTAVSREIKEEPKSTSAKSTSAKSTSAKSTSATPVRESSKEKSKSPKEKENTKLKVPTKLQLEKWTSSINALLADEEGILAFEAFLEECETEPGEYKKYIDFYRECTEFKRKMCHMEAEAERIYETYLEVGSDREVGTRGKGEEVGKRLEKEGFPQKTLFDTTQQKVKEKLDEGLYVNFCKNLMEKHKL